MTTMTQPTTMTQLLDLPTAEPVAWRAVPAFDGYEASADGQVRSLDRTVVDKRGHLRNIKGTVLKSFDNGTGYRFVYLNKGGRRTKFYVHRLVMLAFFGPPPVVDGVELLHVNHKDGRRTNNALSNLEYVTPADNQAHRVHTLGNSSLPVLLSWKVVRNMRLDWQAGKSVAELAILARCSERNVYLILNGKTWNNGQYYTGPIFDVSSKTPRTPINY